MATPADTPSTPVSWARLALLCVFGMFVACAGHAGTASAQARSRSGGARLPKPTAWRYVLQGKDGGRLDLARLARTPADLIVIDHASHGVQLTRRQLRRLKSTPTGGRRLVLAYLSIGEAEDYRFYWKPSWRKRAPKFLDRVNPRWAGNYKVRYWDPAWQRILFGVQEGREKSYVDRIIDQGFDGVYLDLVDAFEYFAHRGAQPPSGSPADHMARLVLRIARYARSERGAERFIVIPQNGANILDHLSPALGRAYLRTVDGIAAEDTFFPGERDHDNPLAVQTETLSHLRQFAAAGKVVLAVEYLRDSELARRFVERARAEGFVPLIAPRQLDELIRQPGEG